MIQGKGSLSDRRRHHKPFARFSHRECCSPGTWWHLLSSVSLWTVDTVASVPPWKEKLPPLPQAICLLQKVLTSLSYHVRGGQCVRACTVGCPRPLMHTVQQGSLGRYVSGSFRIYFFFEVGSASHQGLLWKQSHKYMNEVLMPGRGGGR